MNEYLHNVRKYFEWLLWNDYLYWFNKLIHNKLKNIPTKLMNIHKKLM